VWHDPKLIKNPYSVQSRPTHIKNPQPILERVKRISFFFSSISITKYNIGTPVTNSPSYVSNLEHFFNYKSFSFIFFLSHHRLVNKYTFIIKTLLFIIKSAFDLLSWSCTEDGHVLRMVFTR
jgi:hypothetical protein